MYVRSTKYTLLGLAAGFGQVCKMGTQWEHVKLLPDTAALFLPYPGTWPAGCCWLAIGMACPGWLPLFNPARAGQASFPRPCTHPPIHPIPAPTSCISRSLQLAARTSHLAAAVWARIPGCGPATDPQGPPAHRTHPVFPRRAPSIDSGSTLRRSSAGVLWDG